MLRGKEKKRKGAEDYVRMTQDSCRRRLALDTAAVTAIGCSELCLLKDVLGHDGHGLACVNFDAETGGAKLATQGVAGPCGWGLDATLQGRAAEYAAFLADAWALPGVRKRPHDQATRGGAALVELTDGVTVSRDFAKLLRLLHIPVLAASSPADRAAEDVTLIPDLYFARSRGYASLNAKVDAASLRTPWQDKKAKVTFRGSSTGSVPQGIADLDANIRLKLALHARSKARGNGTVAAEVELERAWDVGISQLVQVSAEVGDEVRRLGLTRREVDAATQVRSRGVFDVDGNTNSWSGCWWKLRSNSVTLKVSSEHRQWYYPLLAPWVHFVPVKSDLSDVDQQAAFVLNPANDEKLLAIAASSTALVKTLSYASEAAKVRRLLEGCFAGGLCSPKAWDEERLSSDGSAALGGNVTATREGAGVDSAADPALVAALNGALVRGLGALLERDPKLWRALEKATACVLYAPDPGPARHQPAV